MVKTRNQYAIRAHNRPNAGRMTSKKGEKREIEKKIAEEEIEEAIHNPEDDNILNTTEEPSDEVKSK